MSRPYNVFLAKVLEKVIPQLTANDDEQPRLNSAGQMIIAQGLPPAAELSRMGNSYLGVGTTVAPVTDLPSTTAHLSLFNGEQDGGKSYIIDAIGTSIRTSAGAAITLAMSFLLNKGKKTNPAGAIAPLSLVGRQSYAGKGNLKASVTVTDDGWQFWGDSYYAAATSNDNTVIERRVDGMIIVPPGYLFSVASICDSAGSSACFPFIKWHEVQIELGF